MLGGSARGRLQIGAARTSRALLSLVVLAGVLALVPASPAAAAGKPSPARIESFSLASRLIDTSTPGGKLEKGRTAPKVNVLLPAGYDDHPHDRYPLIWLLHGANGGTDTWVRSVERMTAGTGAIVVMPDGGVFGMYMDWWNGGRRGGPAWTTYHLDVLRRTIERRYRIRPGRRWHAIGGISMGGQGALRYAAMLPGYFGSVAGFSAALPDMQSLEAQVGLGVLVAAGGGTGVTYDAVYGPATGAYANGNSAAALTSNYEHTRMFLSSGDGLPCPGDSQTSTFYVDIVTELFIGYEQPRFAARARAAGADVTDAITCGVHTFGPWDRAFVAAQRWGWFGPVPESPSEWTYRTVAASGEVWGLSFRFARPPSQVVELRRDGRRLTVDGTGELALRGPGGCKVDLELPYRGLLPAACVSSS